MEKDFRRACDLALDAYDAGRHWEAAARLGLMIRDDMGLDTIIDSAGVEEAMQLSVEDAGEAHPISAALKLYR